MDLCSTATIACTWAGPAMFLFGLLGVVFIVWGAIRQTISKGLEVASEIGGSQTGQTTFRKAGKTGWWIFGSGVVMLALAILIGVVFL